MIQRRNTKIEYSASMYCFSLNIVSRGGEGSLFKSSDMGNEVSACDRIMLQKKPSANVRIKNFCFEYKNHLDCSVRARLRLGIIKPSCDGI